MEQTDHQVKADLFAAPEVAGQYVMALVAFVISEFAAQHDLELRGFLVEAGDVFAFSEPHDGAAAQQPEDHLVRQGAEGGQFAEVLDSEFVDDIVSVNGQHVVCYQLPGRFSSYETTKIGPGFVIWLTHFQIRPGARSGLINCRDFG